MAAEDLLKQLNIITIYFSLGKSGWLLLDLVDWFYDAKMNCCCGIQW